MPYKSSNVILKVFAIFPLEMKISFVDLIRFTQQKIAKWLENAFGRFESDSYPGHERKKPPQRGGSLWENIRWRLAQSAKVPTLAARSRAAVALRGAIGHSAPAAPGSNQTATPASKQNSRPNGRLLAGWGSWIRTSECRSQSPVPYRLAIPQCEQSYYITKKADCQAKKEKSGGRRREFF